MGIYRRCFANLVGGKKKILRPQTRNLHNKRTKACNSELLWLLFVVSETVRWVGSLSILAMKHLPSQYWKNPVKRGFTNHLEMSDCIPNVLMHLGWPKRSIQISFHSKLYIFFKGKLVSVSSKPFLICPAGCLFKFRCGESLPHTGHPSIWDVSLVQLLLLVSKQTTKSAHLQRIPIK